MASASPDSGRVVQRGLAKFVPCARIGPGGEQRLDGLRLALPRSLVQRGAAAFPVRPGRPRRPAALRWRPHRQTRPRSAAGCRLGCSEPLDRPRRPAALRWRPHRQTRPRRAAGCGHTHPVRPGRTRRREAPRWPPFGPSLPRCAAGCGRPCPVRLDWLRRRAAPRPPPYDHPAPRHAAGCARPCPSRPDRPRQRDMRVYFRSRRPSSQPCPILRRYPAPGPEKARRANRLSSRQPYKGVAEGEGCVYQSS